MTKHAILSLFALSLPALAQNDAAGNDTGPDHLQLKPVAQWLFEGADTLGTWTGKAKLDESGPRPPNYPGFAKDNHAAHFTGDGTKQALEIKDSQELRFGLNDTITLEA